MKRNYEVDFWKFVFCIVIVIHHSCFFLDQEEVIFLKGSLSVEFFF